MAAGSDLPLLAAAVAALHFVIVFGLSPLGNIVDRRGHAERTYTISYDDGHGILRDVLTTCSQRSWTVKSLTVLGDRGTPVDPIDGADGRLVTVVITLTGPAVATAPRELGTIPGVMLTELGDDDE